MLLHKYQQLNYHSIATIIDFDYIIVMEDGLVAESGSPNDLLALVVRPDPTDRITHLAYPGSGDAVEEAADPGGMDYFLEGGNLWSLESDFLRV